MKSFHYFFMLSFLFHSFFMQAQWSTDPASPGVVCDFSGIQSDPQAFADGDGGVYVFWLDHRNGTSQDARDIYGQRYDTDGYALWEEDGRLIMSHPNKINWFNISRFENNEMILGWVSHLGGDAADSLKIQKLDEDGAMLWSDDLTVSHTGFEPNAILYLSGYNIVHDDAGYCVGIDVIHYGGSTRNWLTRFTSDGILTGPYDGEPEGGSYGSSGLKPAFDAGNSVYLYYSSGNGSGAPLYCLKLSITGDTLWGPVNVLSGTSGLNYQFSGFSDSNGMTFVWQGNGDGGTGTNLYARRLNADGTFDWGGSTATICAADGEQSKFHCRKNGDNYYITWADGRPGVSPGNYDIYAQKFDINGDVQWAENGIEVISLNTYIPYPEFDFSENNSMIICHQSSSVGFVAQKVLDDGTVAWDEDGNLICIKNFSPFYEEHVEVQTGDKTIAVWAKTQSGGGSNDIFITRVDDNETTGLVEMESRQLQLFPNPASDELTIMLPEGIDDFLVSVFDSFGREVFKQKYSSTTSEKIGISVSDLQTGQYVVRVLSDAHVYSQTFIVK